MPPRASAFMFRIAVTAAFFALFTPAPVASAAFTTYINTWLGWTYADNCYYGTSEGCSGWNYWKYNIVTTQHSSSTNPNYDLYHNLYDIDTCILAGFDTTTVIRGKYMCAHRGPLYVTPQSLNMNLYNRAMTLFSPQGYWQGDFLYTTGSACTSNEPECS